MREIPFGEVLGGAGIQARSTTDTIGRGKEEKVYQDTIREMERDARIHSSTRPPHPHQTQKKTIPKPSHKTKEKDSRTYTTSRRPCSSNPHTKPNPKSPTRIPQLIYLTNTYTNSSLTTPKRINTAPLLTPSPPSYYPLATLNTHRKHSRSVSEGSPLAQIQAPYSRELDRRFNTSFEIVPLGLGREGGSFLVGRSWENGGGCGSGSGSGREKMQLRTRKNISRLVGRAKGRLEVLGEEVKRKGRVWVW